jgi:hypothetical protein
VGEFANEESYGVIRIVLYVEETFAFVSLCLDFRNDMGLCVLFLPPSIDVRGDHASDAVLQVFP